MGLIRSFAALGVVASLFLAAPALAQPNVPDLRDLPYGDGHARQVLDIYAPEVPACEGGRPAVIWIHGGGWQNGDKSSAQRFATVLVPRGFVVVGINYRLSGQATWLAQMHDCKAALRWVRANAAAYGIDPERIGVWGSSAGGHLASVLATSSGVATLEGTVGPHDGVGTSIQAAADYFGPADFFSGWHSQCTSPESALLGFCIAEMLANLENPAWDDEEALARSAMPATHLDANDPPFHISHGTADPVVPYTQSIAFSEALGAAGVPRTLRIIDGAGHAMPLSEDALVASWFAERLNPGPYKADFNGANGLSVQDIYDFLSAWNSQAGATGAGHTADFNADQRVGVQDIYDFLAAWTGGCGG